MSLSLQYPKVSHRFPTTEAAFGNSVYHGVFNVFVSLRQTFPAEGSRQAVVVEVSRTTTCETVCESIAAQLDVADARVIIRDRRGGETLVEEKKKSEK